VNSRIDQKPITPIQGYLEGYYGKLLSWSERDDVLRFLARQGANTYCYAPKEDASHRLQWRTPYSTQWSECFAQFCQRANELDVSVVAGIAPGLDFNFDQKDSRNDFNYLHKKADHFIAAGACEILILWDDIDEGCFVDSEGLSEGAAHARIVNQLSEALGRALWTVPRVYAAEIENKNLYLEDFFGELQPQNTVLVCGNAIVAESVSRKDLARFSRTPIKTTSMGNDKKNSATKHRMVVWDNFYANDYCPRRLFIGPWTGREDIRDYLLNPTGLPFTDRLLLDIALSTHTDNRRQENWAQALKRHGVPDAFLAIAPYFVKPFFGDRAVLGDDRDTIIIEATETIDRSIEICLWEWKSPLAREWYPFIFGLKHDLALRRRTMPRERVLKTQTTELAKRLLT